jgi:hypothetical protein
MTRRRVPRYQQYQGFGQRAIDLADKWATLEREGLSRRAAASRLGVKFPTLDRAIQRAAHYRAREDTA